MTIIIKDKNIDEEIEKIIQRMRNEFGIKTVSKTDAIRFLLKMRQQGKKTHRKWGAAVDRY